MKLNNFIIGLYLLVSALLFISFFENLFVWGSFFANWLFLTIMFIYHLKIEKTYSPFLSAYITFNFLFFILAPMVQIGSFDEQSHAFPNYFPYSESKVVYANVLILCFHFCFFMSYLFFKKRHLKKPSTITVKDINSKYTPLTVLIILLAGIMTLYLSRSYIINLFTESHWITNARYNISVSGQLILKKVLYMMPLGAIVLIKSYFQNNRKITNNAIILFLVYILLITLLLVFKNPLTEKRNAIGPIYITLLFLFAPKTLNSNSKSFLFLFFSLVILFPLVAGLTHLDATIMEIINNPSLITEHYEKEGIVSSFFTLHYDAFANVMATAEYVSKHGMSFGFQLLSGLLFFVPRSIWASKPTSTGELIGNYVIDEYDFVYHNLSNPMVSEGYINFGFIGIILMATALAYFVVKLLNWLFSNDPLKRIMAFYFSVHLLFFLRGDFTNGFSYFIGTLIGVMLIPKAINVFLAWSFKKKKRVNESNA
ncbi:O-antigen polysaccharide polymerase Wzy [Winogradskyella sp. 3972H.M.0a.05]|uniref:O-antigen polymerase n=1 Tax=Winogradskyella sp. 3972H.M.0a.05 TaxID=2950277 RepID=UPI003398FD0F